MRLVTLGSADWGRLDASLSKPGLCLLVVRVGVAHAQVRDEKLNVVAEDIDDRGSMVGSSISEASSGWRSMQW